MGKMTGMMNAEDKVLLLGECVPMHEGTAEERQVRARLFVCLRGCKNEGWMPGTNIRHESYPPLTYSYTYTSLYITHNRP